MGINAHKYTLCRGIKYKVFSINEQSCHIPSLMCPHHPTPTLTVPISPLILAPHPKDLVLIIVIQGDRFAISRLSFPCCFFVPQMSEINGLCCSADTTSTTWWQNA